MNEETTVSAPVSGPPEAPSPDWVEAPSLPRSGGILGRRRRFLVDPRSQLRASAMVMVTAIALVLLLNLSLHSARVQDMASVMAVTPALEDTLKGQQRLEAILVAIASLLFLVAVFVITILETHKTAGSARNLVLQLNRVESGDYSARLVLRKGDNLREVQDVFNRMSEALEQRASEEIAELQALAALAARIEDPAGAHALAARIGALAARKRDP